MPSRLRRLLGLTAVLASGLSLVPLSAARTETAHAMRRRCRRCTCDAAHRRHRPRDDPPRREALDRPRGGTPTGRCRRRRSPRSASTPYVVPKSALPLLAAHRLDLRPLRRRGADRTAVRRRATGRLSPVIVDYAARRGSGRRNRTLRRLAARTQDARCSPSLGAAAFAAEKAHARAFWRSLTAAPNADGALTALAGGPRASTSTAGSGPRSTPRSRRSALPRPGPPASTAPASPSPCSTPASTRPPRPRRPGRRARRASCPRSVGDVNGHGTHVASTIAGTGAAPAASYKGVAPGATCWSARCSTDAGSGEDSWVIAGHGVGRRPGADVVNMSLGGRSSSDGTDP